MLSKQSVILPRCRSAEELLGWSKKFSQELTSVLTAALEDIHAGNIPHKTFDSFPDVGDLEETEMALAMSGGNAYLCTRLRDVIYKTPWMEMNQYAFTRVINDCGDADTWTLVGSGLKETVYNANSSWLFWDGDELIPSGYKCIKHDQLDNLESTIHRGITTMDLSTAVQFGMNVFFEPSTGWSYNQWDVYLFSRYPDRSSHYYKFPNMQMSDERLIKGYWNKVQFNKTYAEVVGEPDWSTINGIQFTIRPTTGAQARHYWGPLYYMQSGLNRGKVILTFDDTCNSVYDEAFAYMVKFGYRGVAFVNAKHIIEGTTGVVAAATIHKLRHMILSGWDISNHTYNHVCLQWQTLELQEAEVSSNITWLNANGLDNAGTRFFAYPNYRPDQRSWHLFPKYARVCRGGGDAKEWATVWPFNNPLNTPSLTWMDANTVEEWIIKVKEIQDQRLVGIMVFHDIGIVGSWGQMAPAKFQSFIDILNEYNIDVVTLTDVFGGAFT